jgi:arylsulfatase A-like enzyme
MRKFIPIFLLMNVCLLACNTQTNETQGKEDINKNSTPPNVLFVLADDHRWDLLGKTHPIIKTPTLDKLAEQGVKFNNAFVTTPICASSRISILTGLTERTHDYTFGQPKTGAVESSLMYPALLKKQGYQSAFVGKYEIKMSGDDEERFDYFKPLLQAKTENYKGKDMPQTYYISSLASDFIEQASEQPQPWAMSVNFWNPHAHDVDQENQYHYPPAFNSMYEDITIPEASLSDDADFEKLPDFLQDSIARKRWQYRFGSPDIYQKMTKRHYRAISSVDDALGRIIQTLKDTGQYENTIIIYTGDNGYFLNERQLAGKWYGWEEALRVPLIIFDPRQSLAKNKEVEDFALNIDIAPTILDFAGIDAPQSYQGKSLRPLLTESQDIEWRDEFFFEHMYQPKRVSIPPMVGVRTEKWKYVNFFKNGYEQLYDLTRDHAESENLATTTEYADILKRLREKTANYVALYESQRTDEVRKRESFKNTLPPDTQK